MLAVAPLSLGSIFFAFVIAVIQLVRIIMYAIDKYTKKQQDKNLLLKVAIKCAVLPWCFEKTVKFITTIAASPSMRGLGFCRRALRLTQLLLAPRPALNQHLRADDLSWIQPLGLPIACGFATSSQSTRARRSRSTLPSSSRLWPSSSRELLKPRARRHLLCARAISPSKGIFDRLRPLVNKKSKKNKKGGEAKRGGGGACGREYGLGQHRRW